MVNHRVKKTSSELFANTPQIGKVPFMNMLNMGFKYKYMYFSSSSNTDSKKV